MSSGGVVVVVRVEVRVDCGSGECEAGRRGKWEGCAADDDDEGVCCERAIKECSEKEKVEERAEEEGLGSGGVCGWVVGAKGIKCGFGIFQDAGSQEA